MKIVGTVGPLARIFFFVVFVNFSCSQAAVAEDVKARLLPGSVMRDMRMAFKQDGRVLDLVLTAPNGKWVITELDVKVEFQRDERADAIVAAQGALTKEERKAIVDNPYGWHKWRGPFYAPTETEAHKIIAEVQPDRSLSTHLELKGEKAVSSVKILEARGREQTMMDRVKAVVR